MAIDLNGSITLADVIIDHLADVVGLHHLIKGGEEEAKEGGRGQAISAATTK